MANNTLNLGRLYISIAPQAQGAPLIDRAITVEKDGEQRRGSGILIRAPFTKHRPTCGLNIGIWRHRPGAEQLPCDGGFEVLTGSRCPTAAPPLRDPWWPVYLLCWVVLLGSGVVAWILQ